MKTFCLHPLLNVEHKQWKNRSNLKYFKIAREGMMFCYPKLEASWREFCFQFCTFRWGFLFILVILQFWACVIFNYTQNISSEIFLYTIKVMLRLTFYPELSVDQLSNKAMQTKLLLIVKTFCSEHLKRKLVMVDYFTIVFSYTCD